MSYDSWKTTEPDLYDPGRQREAPDREDPPTCDQCGDTAIRFSLAGVGLACSQRCMDILAKRHETAMASRTA